MRTCPTRWGAVAALVLGTGSLSIASGPTLPGTRDGAGVVRLALRSEVQHLGRQQVQEYLSALDEEASRISSTLSSHPSEGDLLSALNSHFFGPEGFAALTDLAAPENGSVAAVLDNRRGTCVGLAIAYVALARRLGLDAHAVATPVHVFVRVRIDGIVRNVELLEAGHEIDDDTYRRRYRIDPESIAAAAFMADLTTDELLAHLLSNQAVSLSKQGRLRAALRRHGRALRLHPGLVAAWYNRGIDLMNDGRLEKSLASFTRAIELYPSDAQAHNNRGLARLKLGDPEGARADWEEALQLEPGLKEAEENLKRLLAGRLTPQ